MHDPLVVPRLHHRSRRSASSYRQAIASAIARRISTGEPLSIRAILSEAGGGSTDTVREELQNAGQNEGARMLQGDRIRSSAEREAALRDQLKQVSAERDALRTANSILERAIRTAAEPSKILEHQVSEIERRVRGSIEEVLREAARFRRAREKGVETVIVADATLEARYQQLVQDHGHLIEKFNRLRSRFFEATGEYFD